ncbi:FRG domain-containing protein [Rhizobium herbae]
MTDITSVGELIEIIRAAKAAQPKAIWFRGQADSSWKLLPGLLRQENRISESTLLSRFKQSAAMLASNRPTSTFDWIFLMQHHGVPTRLLDWSENPLVALYFAVSGFTMHSETDAALWFLRPSDLNKHANIVDKDEGDYIPSFDDEEVEAYSTEHVRAKQRLELYPIATIATRNSPRIQAQLGTFTIHHNARKAIDEVGDGSHCDKHVIPRTARQNLLEELSILGMNRFSLFPEMDSISGLLKEMM